MVIFRPRLRKASSLSREERVSKWNSVSSNMAGSGLKVMVVPVLSELPRSSRSETTLPFSKRCQ